jgi:hypothetical protein
MNMLLWFMISLHLSAVSVSRSETVMDMYAAKLRTYLPDREFANGQDIAQAAGDAILQYNRQLSEGSLSRGGDAYMLNIFGVLCAISTTSWEYDEANKCRKRIELNTAAHSMAKDLLVTLFELAHGNGPRRIQ